MTPHKQLYFATRIIFLIFIGFLIAGGVWYWQNQKKELKESNFEAGLFSSLFNKRSSTCMDSDGGLNYDSIGKTTKVTRYYLFGIKRTKTYHDKCLDNKILQEYYCKSNEVHSKNYSCSFDCLNGACKIRQDEAESIQESTEPKPICQNECLQAEMKKCSDNGYQVCGNYDADDCLEWSETTNCPRNTICQNGTCIQSAIETFSKPNYNCNFCNNFCYVSDGSKNNLCYKGIFFEWKKELTSNDLQGQNCQSDVNCWPGSGFKCINQLCLWYLWDNPYGLPLKITPIFPRSIPLGSNFDLKLVCKNEGEVPIKITINDILFFLYKGTSSNDDHKISYEITREIAPNEETEFVIPIDTDTVRQESMMANIQLKINTDRGIHFILEINPLIIYNQLFEKTCNGIKYNSKNAVCINDILYPVGIGRACIEKNKDCDSCLHYSCFNPIYFLKPDKEYNVLIPRIFIYEDNVLFEQQRNTKLKELQELVKRANDWFVNEKKFWNSNSQFAVKYKLSDEDCLLSKNKYLSIIKLSNSGYNFNKNLLKQCNIKLDDYNIIAVNESWQDGLLDNEIYNELNRMGIPGVAGINYGDILNFGLKGGNNEIIIGPLIHETLHSFGETDLYLQNGYQNAFFQERNCNLFRAQWTDFEKYPHLCAFEAKIIGWTK